MSQPPLRPLPLTEEQAREAELRILANAQRTAASVPGPVAVRIVTVHVDRYIPKAYIYFETIGPAMPPKVQPFAP